MEHFLWKNHAQNVHQKLVPDPFFILKEDYQKPLKILILIFLLNPVCFSGQVIKNKRGLELMTCPSSGYKTSSQKFLY